MLPVGLTHLEAGVFGLLSEQEIGDVHHLIISALISPRILREQGNPTKPEERSRATLPTSQACHALPIFRARAPQLHRRYPGVTSGLARVEIQDRYGENIILLKKL
jgi:hypothetical protein